MLAAVTCFAAGKKKDAYDIRPDAEKPTDAPIASTWQAKNRAQLADATKPEVIAAFVKDAASAAALLSEVKTGYQTDPVKSLQIAAVTQCVMCKKCKSARELWAGQLLAFAQKSEALDVKMYYLDQLRWCGLPTQAAAVREIGRLSTKKCIKDFAEWVASELDNSAAARAGF